MRQLTDGVGAVQRVQSYTPFGEVLGGTGSATSAFGYSSERQDPSRLLFLRGRYYDGMAGRFTQRDPWPGDVQRPYSLNWYQYG